MKKFTPVTLRIKSWCEDSSAFLSGCDSAGLTRWVLLVGVAVFYLFGASGVSRAEWQVPSAVTGVLEADIYPGEEQVFAPLIMPHAPAGKDGFLKILQDYGSVGDGATSARITTLGSPPVFLGGEPEGTWLGILTDSSVEWSRNYWADYPTALGVTPYWIYWPLSLGSYGSDLLSVGNKLSFEPYWTVDGLLGVPSASGAYAAASSTLSDRFAQQEVPEYSLNWLWANSAVSQWGGGAPSAFYPTGGGLLRDSSRLSLYYRSSSAGAKRRLIIQGAAKPRNVRFTVVPGISYPVYWPDGRFMTLADAGSTTALGGLNLYTATAATSKLKGLPTAGSPASAADQLILFVPSPIAEQPPRWEAFYRTANNAAWASTLRTGTISTTLASSLASIPGSGFYIRRGTGYSNLDLTLAAPPVNRLDVAGTPAIVDVDGDQMADVWEMSHKWPSAPAVMATGGGLLPTDDLDEDGQDNLTEYLFGTNPKVFNAPVRPTVTFSGSGAATTLSVSFPAKAGRRYRLQQMVNYISTATDTTDYTAGWTDILNSTLVGSGGTATITLPNVSTSGTGANYFYNTYRAVRFFRILALHPVAGANNGDTDSDGISNLEEAGFDGFPGYGSNANSDDTDGDGLKDKVEVMTPGQDPLDRFDRAFVKVLSGDAQIAPTGGWFRRPIRVLVNTKLTSTTWGIVSNFPVTFAITSGNGGLAASPDTDITQPVMTVMTDATGHAEIWLKAGSTVTPISCTASVFLSKVSASEPGSVLRMDSFIAYPSPHLKLPELGLKAWLRADRGTERNSNGVLKWQPFQGDTAAHSFNLSDNTTFPTYTVDATTRERYLLFSGATLKGMTLQSNLGNDTTVIYVAQPTATRLETLEANVLPPGTLALLRSTQLTSKVNVGTTNQEYLFASDRPNLTYTLPATGVPISLTGQIGFGLSLGTSSIGTYDLSTFTGALTTTPAWNPATMAPREPVGVPTLGRVLGSFIHRSTQLSDVYVEQSVVPSVSGSAGSPYATLASGGYLPLKHIGNVPGMASSGFTGHVYDVVLYNRVLSASELVQVRRFLAAQYQSLTQEDSDDDDLPDWWEWAFLGSLNSSGTADDDNDGLTNVEELAAKTHPALSNTDRDGWSDYHEVVISGTDPLAWDTDGDFIPDSFSDAKPTFSSNGQNDGDSNGVIDGLEFLATEDQTDVYYVYQNIFLNSWFPRSELLARATGNSLLYQDTDGDGMPNYWETFFSLNPNSGLDATSNPLTLITNPDKDGLSNLQEFQLGLNPWMTDTDFDGMPDTWEFQNGLDGTNPDDATSSLLTLYTDTDLDGLSNRQEYQMGTHPSNPDSDGDGMADGYEVLNGLSPVDPMDADADNDGDRVPNLWEYLRGTAVNNATSKPDWDAIVDPRLFTNDAPNKKFVSVTAAYNSLPNNDPSGAYLILVMPGVQLSWQGFSSTEVTSRRVAIINAGSPDREGEKEAPIVQGPWNLSGEVLVDGLVFEGENATVTVASLSGQPPAKARFINCLFRDISPERFPGASAQYGALTLLSGQLSLCHCTLHRCNSYTTVGLDEPPVAAVANLGGSQLVLKNSIIWDSGRPSSTPVTGTNLSILSSLIQGGISGSINVNPQLMSKGYPTTASTACFQAAVPSPFKWDLHGQPRSATTPTLGAVEWINPDGDGLPDWWERWWFNHLNTSTNDITNPEDRYREPVSEVTRARTALEYFRDFPFLRPTYSSDGDNLLDDWEMRYFHDLDEVDTGNPDGDARNNLQEQTDGTNPLEKDWDFDSEPDGLEDGWEKLHFGSIALYDGEDDPDFDGWTNVEEQANGTDPNVGDIRPDSDNDGLPDSWEVDFFSAQLPAPFVDRSIAPGETALQYALRFSGTDDCDQDDALNHEEYAAGTSPVEKPYLYDGNTNNLWDWWEIKHFGDLLASLTAATDDPDGDRRSNEREMLEGTNPMVHEALPVRGGLYDYSFHFPIPELQHDDGTGFEHRYVIASKTLQEDDSFRYSRIPSWGEIKTTEFLDLSLPPWKPNPDFMDVVPGEGVEAWYRESVESENSEKDESRRRTQARFRISPGKSPAKRLIVKTYRKYQEWLRHGGLASTYHFIIPRGSYHSLGLPVNLEPPKNGEANPKADDEIEHGFISYDWLVEGTTAIPRSLPPSDVAGPRYRKIGLNGVPMPDSLPGEQNAGSTLPEETYVDAYTRQLRHSTSDVWSSSPSTDIPIQARRDLTPESWSWSSGLRPDERPDRPFGPGWTSNLTPHVKLETSENLDLAYQYKLDSFEALYEEKLRNPPQVTLVDERGATYSFVELSYPGRPLNWVPAPNERFDAKTSFDRLFQVGDVPLKDVVQFQLHKRNGTVSHFQLCDLVQTFPQDRINPDSNAVVIKYYRMTHAVTAQGNQVDYDYGGQDVSLIPSEIRDSARPDCKLLITQDKGRIVAVTGPSGETAHYLYDEALLAGVPQQVLDSKAPGFVKGSAGGMNYGMLTAVRRLDSTTTPATVLQEVKYDYSYAFELDPTPDDTQITRQTYGHIELASITDELSNTYHFTHGLNHSTLYDVYNGAHHLTRKQAGIPRLLKTLKRPDDSTVTFGGTRNVRMSETKVVTGGIQTVVSGPAGSYTYTFGSAYVYQPVQMYSRTTEGVVFLSFRQMDIQSAAGTEHYLFNPAAGMALSSVTDLSGKVTSYQYLDPVQTDVALLDNGLAALNINYYDDPTKEISAIHNKPRDPLDLVPDFGGNHVGTKTYTYDPVFRTQTSMTDERGIRSITLLDPATGLPTETKVVDTQNTTTTTDDVILRRTLSSYVHPTAPTHPDYAKFKAFLYRQTVETTGFSSPAGYVAPVGSPAGPALQMVTDYLPDANGRVWQETRYAGPGLTHPMSTLTTYTSGGQKLTVTDARNHTTSFEYYPQTLRLKATHFPGAVSKFLHYDAHGNVVKEVDETGYATLHEYDSFHRRKKTVVDLNGDGDADAGYTTVALPAVGNPEMPSYNGDIVTTTTYNAFNLPVDITDPRGVVTHHDYDPIGRVTHTTVNATDPDLAQRQITRYTNENADITDDFVGGSIFDTQGFKPLKVTDPRGFVTVFEYDDAYRVRASTLLDTSYSPTMQVTSRTLYDDAGNAVYQVDALNRITRTVYDGLSQPIEVHYPQDVNTPAASTKSFYTPAGQVWRTLDEEGAESLTFYDYAGRKTHLYAPAVLDHLTQQMKRPLTVTDYDDVGNATHIHDALGRITEMQYDSRNRSTHVLAPAVAHVTHPTAVPAVEQPVTETQYDDAGRVVRVIDPLGAETTTLYDRGGRAYRVIAPPTGAQTHVTTNKLDPAGNVLEATNARGLVTTNVYDNFGRLKQTTDASAISNHFTYDPSGNRLTVWDGLAQETSFTYDAQNRLTLQTFENLDELSYTYNTLQKTSQEDALGRVTSYGYDARDRLRTTVSVDLNRTQTYDLTGRLHSVAEATSAQAAVTLTYNALGWVTSETSNGLTHSYGYDLAGNRVHAAYGTGRTVTTTLDVLNRPQTITEGGRTTTYGYDLTGRAVKLLMGNGNLCWNVYDVLGRLKQRTLYADATAATTLTQLEWDYDALGNVLSHHEQWPGTLLRTAGWRVTAMIYDDSNRLEMETVSHSGLEMTRTEYTYDAAHNRQTKEVSGDGETGFWNYHYNGANQLDNWQKRDQEGGTLQKNANLAYENGNRSHQIFADAGGTQETEYHWDAQNRLVGVTLPDTSAWAYAYDYRVRRLRTQVSGGPATAKTTKLSFSGGLSVGEWEATTGEPSVLATPTVEYTRGPDMGGGVGGLLYSVRSSTAKFNLSNGRGDIVAQSDSTGALSWTASYEAYGKRTKETGVNEDKQRANSKDEDPTGLLNEGFRYRDLETGVFLSRDPAGFVDGPNLYAYVQQNPWTKFDPEGLFWSAIITAGFAAYDTYQYATGQMSGADYAGAMALNGAALLADVATAGQGGGLAVRAGNATIKIAKAVDKANNIAETAQAAVDTSKTIVAAVKEGDGRGVMRVVGGAILDAATDKVMGKVMGKKGGAHRDTTKPARDGLDSHHMPADSINGMPTNDGPAIKMDPTDHAETSSWGSGRDAELYRAGIKKKIDAGDMRGAMADEIRDVRRASQEVSGDRTKYNSGMREMMDYAREKNIIPKNPQNKIERTK